MLPAPVYILAAVALVGYAFIIVTSPPEERRTQLAQLFAAVLVGAVLVAVT